MAKKRKLRGIDNKCRVCLCDDGCMSDIFSEDLRLKMNDFGKSASIPIEDDQSFPRNICHVCLYKLDMWIDFKNQFIRSNTMLREHLELGELSDSKAPAVKRKHSELQVCAEDNAAELGNIKKLKSDIPSLIPLDYVNSKLKTGKKSDVSDKPVATSGSQKEARDAVKLVEAKEDSEITSDLNPVTTAVSPKAKQAVGRRAKTTERRKESTRRWVARKKALLAATGENDTDTDSMGSDDDQLSPVQKARAKCNAEKVAETHRRITRSFHSLETNKSVPSGPNAETESRAVCESDSEAHKDEAQCKIKTEVPTDADYDSRLPSSNVAAPPNPNNSITENSRNSSSTANNFAPYSVRSELVVDGATFIVTSTLVLSEPHYLKPAQTNDSSPTPPDEATPERNTDIIDAVQLRRVSPKNSQSKTENKLVDTCLNIEVEGTELDALQRVQSELANFVEKDMRKKLTEESTQTEAVDARAKDAFQTLDQQLKTIVEKTIKKNLETCRLSETRGPNTFHGEILRAALRSKLFQPRVLLVRHEPSPLNAFIQKRTRTYNKKIEELPAPLGKRRSVQPAKYADYNTSPFISESEDVAAEEIVKKPSSGPKSSKVKTYGPAATKVGSTPVGSQQKSQKSLLLHPKPLAIGEKPQSVAISPAPEANSSTGEKHICGVCGEFFGTRKEVENHFAAHKKPNKQKMMRCKRCHEIVEARYVKLHVCNASKSAHKCRACGSAFRTEQLLARHEESHKSSERKQKPDNSAARLETTKDAQEAAETSKIEALVEKNVLQVAIDKRESYTCFVCDKTFTDEELLKDHLQKHCDDMSEDERSNAKEYQCAICGLSLDSEEALETHVEKHLFDDEDDNPNLISIGVGDGEKAAKTEVLHSCAQCSESFDSEMLLMLHMQAHEEEVAIAEWERRGIDNAQEEQHVCVICDDLFASEIELSEHLDVHNGNAHICLLCDKPFLTLEELQSHVNTH